MKTILTILILLCVVAVPACVGAADSEPDEASAVAPDAGDAEIKLTLPIRKDVGGSGGIPSNPSPPIDAAPPPSPSLAAIAPDAGVDEGRKGGETSHCTGCR